MAVLSVLCKSCNKFANVDADVVYCPRCAAVYSECLVNLSKLAEFKQASDVFVNSRQMLVFWPLIVLFWILPSFVEWPWLSAFNKSVFPILIFIGLLILSIFVLGRMARKKFPEYHDQK